MADENLPKRPAIPEPASDAKKHAKRVVLSSVAKVAPISESESLLGEPDPAKPGPPELPPKTTDGGLIRPVGWTTRPGGTTTIIKLPPKTGTLPRMMSLSPQARENPPAAPADSAAVNGEESSKRVPPIKIDSPATAAPSEQESIFASPGESSVPVEARALPQPVAPRRAVPPPLPPQASLVKAPPVALPVTPVEKSEPHHVVHVPPLVPHDAPAPESTAPSLIDVRPPEAKADPMAQTVRLSPTPARPPAESAQGVLSLPEAAKPVQPAEVPVARAKAPEIAPNKHRLPPRSSATGRVRLPAVVGEPAAPVSPQKPTAIPPKTFPATAPTVITGGTSTPVQPAAPLTSTPQAIKSSVTPPTIPLLGRKVRPPTIPLRGVPPPIAVITPPISRDEAAAGDEEETDEVEPTTAPNARALKKRRRRLIGIIVFYVLLAALLPCLYEAALFFTQETRVEGQVIPPPGMLLGNEVWIVTDFRDLAAGIADDLASDRQIVVQDMQEKLSHVQRAQADVATREGRIRLLKDQIQSDNDEEMSLMKQARDASQQIWDGPGAQLEVDYQARLTELNHAIAERAKANHLQYDPDPNYYSPEVWANAYRLAMYQVPAGVDAAKEHAWLDGQMKAWHAFTKAMDQKEADLRQQSAQLKLQPSSRVTDLKAQVADLQQRIDATQAEEEPLKVELGQARTDLTAVQEKEAGLDAKPYEMLDALPEKNVTKRLELQSNGRFSWREVEKENKYAADETTHVFWIFARAYRADGRQYWSLNRISVAKNSTTLLTIEPGSFESTKAILRPDLSPDEQSR